MVDQPAPADPGGRRAAERDERGNLSAEFVAAVEAAIEAGETEAARALAGDLHEADVAELISAIDADDRPKLIELLGDRFDFATLTELDESTRLQILEELPAETIAEGMRELDSDDAVYILEDMEAEDQEEILSQIPAVERIALKRSLDYPEESAGRRMQTEFIAVPPFWTVGQTIDHLRQDQELPDEFYEIFVVDPRFRLLGTVPLNRLLRQQRSVVLSDIMDEQPYVLQATLDQEEAARMFGRYNLVSAGVVDEADRLVGVITIDDIVDVINEEAEEDILALAGVGDAELSDSVLTTVRLRFPWLLLTLFTAFVAASVIAIFEDTIEALVALAILLPVNAALAGNAGTQSLAVAVRALATRTLQPSNRGRVVLREALVGMLNGSALAVVAGTVVAVVFRNLGLGLVLAAAMMATVLSATLLGILVPLVLDRVRVDPAVASGVFVATIADVVGFFTFLGLATWWFGVG